MIANPQPSKMTVEAYLEWESRQEKRYEYVNGEALAMADGSAAHDRVVLNLHTILKAHLSSHHCRVLMADVKLQISSLGFHFYPDVMVSCHERDRTASTVIQQPLLIVEVLTSDTEAYDRSRKFAHYRKLTSLREYVLVSAEQVSVECYRRRENHQWLYEPYGAGSAIALESIGFSCPIDVLYEKV